ncbi:hypothetical protein F4809DRAFT_609839 [Biscogniauxia mediterranea]|nr:hypothetical protein F4809DRAFT_609839 [Biscogniauxia mediterranea]
MSVHYCSTYVLYCRLIFSLSVSSYSVSFFPPLSFESRAFHDSMICLRQRGQRRYFGGVRQQRKATNSPCPKDLQDCTYITLQRQENTTQPAGSGGLGGPSQVDNFELGAVRLTKKMTSPLHSREETNWMESILFCAACQLREWDEREKGGWGFGKQDKNSFGVALPGTRLPRGEIMHRCPGFTSPNPPFLCVCVCRWMKTRHFFDLVL